MIDITPWLAPNEVVIVQIGHWAITKITSLAYKGERDLFLVHFCAKNRKKQVGSGIDAQMIQGGESLINKCDICGRKIPEVVTVTFLFATL